jgi:hypothetical protein
VECGQRAGAAQFDPPEPEHAPEQQREHVARFLEDHEREGERAFQMPAVAHEIGFREVAHL